MVTLYKSTKSLKLTLRRYFCVIYEVGFRQFNKKNSTELQGYGYSYNV
jgi:hypothetical protein